MLLKQDAFNVCTAAGRYEKFSVDCFMVLTKENGLRRGGRGALEGGGGRLGVMVS